MSILLYILAVIGFISTYILIGFGFFLWVTKRSVAEGSFLAIIWIPLWPFLGIMWIGQSIFDSVMRLFGLMEPEGKSYTDEEYRNMKSQNNDPTDYLSNK